MSTMYEDQLRLNLSVDQDPILSNDEIQTLINAFATIPIYKLWKPNTAYVVGDRVLPTPRTGEVFEVITAGTSGSNQPKWLDLPSTTNDNSIVWEINTTLYDVPFNVVRASAQGWLVKAGKVANRVDFKTDVTTINRDQLYKHCMAMNKSFMRNINMVTVTPLGHNIATPIRPPLPVIGNAQ